MKDSGNSLEKLPYQVWNVSKYGACADAAITGVMPPPLMELQVKNLFLYFIGKIWRLFLGAVLTSWKLSEIILVFEFSCFYCWADK